MIYKSLLIASMVSFSFTLQGMQNICPGAPKRKYDHTPRLSENARLRMSLSWHMMLRKFESENVHNVNCDKRQKTSEFNYRSSNIHVNAFVDAVNKNNADQVEQLVYSVLETDPQALNEAYLFANIKGYSRIAQIIEQVKTDVSALLINGLKSLDLEQNQSL